MIIKERTMRTTYEYKNETITLISFYDLHTFKLNDIIIPEDSNGIHTTIQETNVSEILKHTIFNLIKKAYKNQGELLYNNIDGLKLINIEINKTEGSLE